MLRMSKNGRVDQNILKNTLKKMMINFKSTSNQKSGGKSQ